MYIYIYIYVYTHTYIKTRALRSHPPALPAPCTLNPHSLQVHSPAPGPRRRQPPSSTAPPRSVVAPLYHSLQRTLRCCRAVPAWTALDLI